MNKNYLTTGFGLGIPKKNSGGNNSTAKPVSVTYAMTNEEVDKRVAYNRGVNSGAVSVAYEQFSKDYDEYKPKQSPQFNSLLKGTTTITAPVLCTPFNNATATSTANTLLLSPVIGFGSTRGKYINGIYVPDMPEDWETRKKRFVESPFNATLETVQGFSVHNVWDAQLKVNKLKDFGHLPGSKELSDAEKELALATHYYLYANSPKKSIDDLDLSSNEQIEVKTVTSEDLEDIQRADACNMLQTIFLRNDEHYVCTTETPWGAPEISTHYLSGLKEEDTVVLFDVGTGRFYRFDADTAESAPIREQLDTLALRQQQLYNSLEKDVYSDVRKASALATQINEYVDKIEAGNGTSADYKIVSTLYEEYKQLTNKEGYETANAEYMEKLSNLQLLFDEQTQLQQTYDAFGFSDVVMNNDWKLQMNNNVKMINEARESFKKYQDYYYSDMYSDTQINSLSDAYRAFLSRQGMFTPDMLPAKHYSNPAEGFAHASERRFNFYAWLSTYLSFSFIRSQAPKDSPIYAPLKESLLGDAQFYSDIKEVCSRTFVRPFEYISENITDYWSMSPQEVNSVLSTAAGMFINNNLVNIGETADMVNSSSLKPRIIAHRIYGNEELMQQAGVMELYEKVMSTPIDDLVHSVEYKGNTVISNTALEAARKNYFADLMLASYWGAYGKTPTYDYELMWKEEDRNFGTFVASMALEICLDPMTWLTWGTNSLAKTGSMIDDVSDALKVAVKASDFADMADDLNFDKLATRIVKDAIASGTKLDDVLYKTLSEEIIYLATEGSTVKTLIKNLPEHKALKFIKGKADDLHRLMTNMNITKESRGKIVRAAREQHIKSAYNTLHKTAQIPLEDLLGDSYKMVSKMQKTYRALNFIDNLAIDLTLPIRPVSKLAKGLRKTLRTADQITHVSTFLGRIQGAWIKLLKGADEIPLNKVDDFMNTALKELERITPTVFNIDEFNDIANLTHCALRSDLIERYTDNVLSVLNGEGTSIAKLNALDEMIKGIGVDGVQNLPELLAYLKKPIGKYNHSIYDMLDNTVIGKLRAMSEAHKLVLYDATASKMFKTLSSLDNWKTETNKILQKFADTPKHPRIVGKQLSAEYNAFIKILDNTRKLYVGGVSSVSQSELFDALYKVQKEFTILYDAAINGKIVNKLPLETAMDGVQNLFTKYADDLRNANARSLYTMNRRVERKVFNKIQVPASKKFITNEFITGVKEYLKGTYGAEVPENVLAKTLLKSIEDLADDTGNVDIAEELRTYLGMLSKAERMYTWIADSDLLEVIEPFLSNRSAVHSFAGLVEGYETLDILCKEVATYNITRKIVNQVADLDIEPACIQGVLDAIAGEQKYINKIWSGINVKAAYTFDHAIDNITDHLINKASQFLASKSNEDTKLFTVLLGGSRRRMCTLNTEHNVLELFDSIKHIEGVTEYLAEDADNYYNVFYSIAKQNEHGYPIAITLHYMDDAGAYKTVTYRNKSVIYDPVDDYVRMNHGISVKHARDEFKELKIGKALPEEKFNEEVSNALKEIKHYASAGEQGNRHIRFIGYNNGIMGTNQDRALKTFISKNAVPMHNDLTIDAADFLRKAKGIPVFNTETRAAIKNVIQLNATEALARNTSEILSVFDDKFLITAKDLSISVRKNIRTLKTNYPADWVESVVNSIDNLDSARARVMKRLDVMSEGFQDVCIREKAIVELVNTFSPGRNITNINIHALLEQSMKLAGSDLTINVQKLIDSTKFSYLYDLEELGKYTTPSKLHTLRTVSNELFTTINKIRQPELIHSVGAAAYEKLLSKMLGELQVKVIANDDYLKVILDCIDTENPITMFSACHYVHKRYGGDLKKLLHNKAFTRTNAYRTVAYADGIIFNEPMHHIFTLSDRLNYSKLYGEWTKHSQFLEEYRYFQEYAKDIDNLTMYQTLYQSVFDANYIVSPSEQIAMTNLATCTDAYISLLKEFDVTPTVHKTSKVAKALDIMHHAERIAELKEIKNVISDVQRTAAIRTVFKLDDNAFYTYLLRDCKNGCIVDTSSTLMQNTTTRNLVLDRIKQIHSKGKCKVVYGEDGFIKLFFDLSELGIDDVDAFYRNMVDAKVDYTALFDKEFDEVIASGNYSDKLQQYFIKYNDARKAVGKWMPSHWNISTFNANTQATAKNLQTFFPESAHLDLDALQPYGLFDESFTCSVWADAARIREYDMIMYHSDDVIKSMGTGLYHVRNNLESIKNMFTLYDNPMQSLNYVFKNTNIKVPDYKAFNKSLELCGYTVHKGTIDSRGMYHIKKINIDSNKTLRACIDDPKVIFTPNDVFTSMVQFSKGQNLAIRTRNATGTAKFLMESLNVWRTKVRSARCTMWLFANGLGAGIRNFVDATGKAYLTIQDKKYFKYLFNAPELLHRFDEVYEKVLAYYPDGEAEDIIRFFSTHADETMDMDIDLMLTIFAHRSSSSSGSMISSIMNVKQSSNFGKLKELCKDTPEITDEMINRAMKVYQKEYSKHAHKTVQNIIEQKNSVNKALKSAGIKGDALDKLTNLYHSYTPSSASFADWARNIPGIFSILGKAQAPDIATTSSKLMWGKSALSNYITMNANVFSAAEDYTRLAMFLYYTDELGYTASRANKQVIKAQFDYSSRPQWLESAETLFPFATFKLYNTQFWLKEIASNPGAMRLAINYTNVAGVGFDSEEIAHLTRMILLRDKISKGEIVLDEDGQVDKENSTEGIWTAMAQTVFGEEGVINLYRGQQKMYAELAGSIPIGRHHVLKLGNTYVEALSFFNAMLTSGYQITHGQVPSLFSDNIYSPLSTVFNGLSYMANNGWSAESFEDWYKDNYHAANDFIPFLGSLYNLAITHMKNGKVNMQDLWAIITNPQLKDEFLHTIGEQFLCITGTVLPSFVGTVYEEYYWDKPIGYDWYNQSEEYKKSHRFVFGVSYVPSFYAKNPATYIDYIAMYKRLGYTSEEAMQILNALYGGDDSKAPVKWAYNQELFDATLRYLLNRGYKMAEALDILMDENLWERNGLGKKLANIQHVSMLNNSTFYKMYDRLPDYIKYTDGQYSALRSYYASKGYNEGQIYAAMLYGNGFIDVKGNYVTVTPAQIESMNKEVNNAYYEFITNLPEWYRYEDGAAARTINYLKDTFGMNTQQARDYIIATNFYVDVHGVAKKLSAEEVAERTNKNKEDFNKYYNSLPSAIRYEKGAYGRTLKYLVQVEGVTEDEAKRLIQQGAYLTLDGQLIDCTDIERVKQYNTWASNQYGAKYEGYIRTYSGTKRYVSRPKRIKKRYIKRAYTRRPYKIRSNNSMTYSLVNVRNGANFGVRNAYKVTLGYNSASAILSTKGNYPQSWRNVAQSYRRNMYKEHYAKYGMSRMQMRSGGWKGYSNASVTRLRRENIYAARRYRNRRVF